MFEQKGTGDNVSSITLPPPGFDALTPDEQIDYVQSLWDHIAGRPDEVPVPDWHRQILADCLAITRKDVAKGQEWGEFEQD
ncbi:MAG TPA: addiction module protein [Pyrinomonadaceae bacterium]|nr:addiction module protein [Pyrinomonadaceae bacterium]